MGLGPRRAPLTHDLTHDTHDVCVFLKPLGPIPRSSYLHAYLIYTYQLLCKLQPPHTARPSSSTLHQALSEGELPPPVATRALWDADLEDAGLVPPSEPAAVLRAPDTTSASCSAKFSKRDAAFPTSWSQLVAIEAKKFFPSRSMLSALDVIVAGDGSKTLIAVRKPSKLVLTMPAIWSGVLCDQTQTGRMVAMLSGSSGTASTDVGFRVPNVFSGVDIV